MQNHSFENEFNLHENDKNYENNSFISKAFYFTLFWKRDLGQLPGGYPRFLVIEVIGELFGV